MLIIKRIGILTFHKTLNYGAMLQMYALYKKLSQFYDVEIVDYYRHEVYKYAKIMAPFRRNIFLYFKGLILDIIHYQKKKERYDRFNTFLSTRVKLSKEYENEEVLKEANLTYDILITGSDQVWNPGIVGELSNIYTLNFGDDNIKRISYAASAGSVDNIKNSEEIYKSKLRRIDFLSVRERDTKEVLEKLLERKVDFVLDPTLLLTRDEWNDELGNNEDTNQKYIFAYVVQNNEEYIKIVNELSLKTGLPVLHFGLTNPGYKNVYCSKYFCGPLEFVNYIKNAEYVVTTSFHATVFSIIFNKRFFVVPHKTTGERVKNLLDNLEIPDRIYYSFNEFKEIDFTTQTDWDIVEQRLEQERKRSFEWLIKSIEESE